jgi:hypothetical protein
MFDDLHWLIILVIFGLLIFYNQYMNNNLNENLNTFDEYKNVQALVNNDMNLDSYKNEQIKSNTKVYIGEYPLKINDYNDTDHQFAAHSIYEVGKINFLTNNEDY